MSTGIQVQDVHECEVMSLESDRDEVVISIGECPSHSIRFDVESAKDIRDALDRVIKDAESF